MTRSRWLACCAAVGLCWLLLLFGVRAEQANSESTFRNGKKAGDERSVLVGEMNGGHETAQRDFCRCVGENQFASVKRIEQALRAPLRSPGLDYTEAPLEEVITDLATTYGIPIQIDDPALQGIGMGRDEPVTVQVHDISLRSALRLMLRKVNLTYIIRDEVLLITTPEEAERELVICAYDVRGVLEDTSEKAIESLIDVVMSCVMQETWAENGGTAVIRPLQPGLLIVAQTRAVHEEVASLLKAIREVRERTPVAAGEGREPEPAGDP